MTGEGERQRRGCFSLLSRLSLIACLALSFCNAYFKWEKRSESNILGAHGSWVLFGLAILATAWLWRKI